MKVYKQINGDYEFNRNHNLKATLLTGDLALSEYGQSAYIYTLQTDRWDPIDWDKAMQLIEYQSSLPENTFQYEAI